MATKRKTTARKTRTRKAPVAEAVVSALGIDRHGDEAMMEADAVIAGSLGIMGQAQEDNESRTQYFAQYTRNETGRQWLGKYAVDLCRTLPQRDKDAPESRAFYCLRNTLNNVERMKKHGGKAVTLATSKAEQNDDGIITADHVPVVVRTNDTSKNEPTDPKAALKVFQRWCRSKRISINTLSLFLDNSDADIRAIANEVLRKKKADAAEKAPQLNEGQNPETRVTSDETGTPIAPMALPAGVDAATLAQALALVQAMSQNKAA